MDPIIIVGLGNPGFEYEDTRHNVGFKVADALGRKLKKKFKPGRGEYLIASASVGGKQVAIIKPLTMMNNSGVAVAEVVDEFGVSLQNLLVVVDDFAIPLGAIRVRKEGSDGGHNGLASLIYQLNSNEFVRIRCGIKKETMPPKSMRAAFVLSPFERDEIPVVEEMTARASDTALEIVQSGFPRAMNKFNM